MKLPVQFSPPHLDKGQIPHPLEGLSRQNPHSSGTENSQMPEVCPGGRKLKFRFDPALPMQTTIKFPKHCPSPPKKKVYISVTSMATASFKTVTCV